MSVNYHCNLIYKDFDHLVKNFTWNSLQTKLAIKTALACALTIALINYLELGFPFWGGISALVMMRPDVGASFAKGWMRSLSCAIGCVLMLFFLGYCIQNPILFSVFIFLGVFLGFYLGFQSKIGYFWMYMLANAVLMGMVALSNPYGDFPLHIAYYRAADIAIGVLVSWFVNIILWPRYAGDELIVNSKNLLSGTVLLIKDFLYQYSEKKYNPVKINNDISELLRVIKSNNSLVVSAKLEKKLFRNHRLELETMFQILEYKMRQLKVIYNSSLEMKESEYPNHYKKLLQMVISNLERMSQIQYFENDKKLIRLFIEMKNIFKDIKSAYSASSEYNKSYSMEEIMNFHEIFYFLESFYNDFVYVLRNGFKYKNKISGFTKIDSDKDDYIVIKFFSYELPIYIPVVIHGIKASCGVLFTFWFCLWLQVPGGYLNMTVAIIAVFASQIDIITSCHKGILRMMGCLLGGAVGMFILSFGVETTSIMLIIIFFITFFTAYIYTAKPGVAYIGLQAGIAFLMCVAGSFTVETSFAPVIERLAGIILAICCMWIVNFIIWPDNMIVNLKKKLAALNEHVLKRIDAYVSKDNDKGQYDKFIDISSIEAVLNNLKMQQDLSSEDLENVGNWVIHIRRICNKLSLIRLTDEGVIEFIEKHHPKILKHFYKNIELSIQINSEQKRKRVQLLLIKEEELIDKFLQELREKGILRKFNIDFKLQCSHVLLSLKRITLDLRDLSKISLTETFQYN